MFPPVAAESASGGGGKAINQIPNLTQMNWTLFYFRAICFERAKQWQLRHQCGGSDLGNDRFAVPSRAVFQLPGKHHRPQ